MTLQAKAAELLSLHRPGDPVVLPTVWDPWSANFAVEAGFRALTIGSHPVAEALGGTDGEGLSLEEMLTHVRRITSAVDVPISADLESGYGVSPQHLIDGLLEAGAVGLNLEDTVHSEGDRLRSTPEHAEYIAGLRAAADTAGVHVVVNARTDILLDESGDESDKVDRAIARLAATVDAGADVLYPCGIHSDAVQRRLTSELPLPVNALAVPTDESLGHLASLGVGRISFGPFLQTALAAVGSDLLSAWRRP